MPRASRSLIAILVLLVLFVLPDVVRAQDRSDLVFPDQEEKICIVFANGDQGGLLGGSRAPEGNKLAERIRKELDLPFHRSVIKLAQCSRNFAGDGVGPNVLFLSLNEGGFPRHGLALKEGEKITEYPNLNFVDLVMNEPRLDAGGLQIFSHELGHVMMMNLWVNFPQARSSKQHASMGVTDYAVAFFEGWGEHFQRLAFDQIPFYQAAFQESYEYHRSTGTLWHSNLDRELRLFGVLQNTYIHRKRLPAVDLGQMSLEELIALDHASPLFDRCSLKNAQEMLSCEGVIATLFYRINSDKILQNHYLEKAFYERFLLSPMPEGVKAQDLFTPFENVILKNFLVWRNLSGRVTEKDDIFLAYIREWCRSFPEDREEILKLFVLTTVGKTVSNELGDIYEKMAYYGMVGNMREFLKSGEGFNASFRKLYKALLCGARSLDANVGPQIWVENKKLFISNPLWGTGPKKPLRINLNTASEFELASFPETGLKRARELVRIREKLSFFKSLEEARKYGFRN